MYKYILIVIFGLSLVAFGQSRLTEETNFLGIPGLSTLNTEWVFNNSTPPYSDFVRPIDVHILKLSLADYRLVVLCDMDQIFTSFRIDQVNGIDQGNIYRSGIAPAESMYPSAMCLVQEDEYFEPRTDRIAVTFKQSGKIGIYSYDNNHGTLNLESTFSNPLITVPVGIFYAFNNYFIADQETQVIYRMDSQGTGLHPIFWTRHPSSLSGGLGLFVLQFELGGWHVAEA